MDITVVSRLTSSAVTQNELDNLINTAMRHATTDQLSNLKVVERNNRYRISVSRQEGSIDFHGRVAEALRVLEAFLSIKNGRTTRAGYTRRSLTKNGPVEALRRIIAKRDSSGLQVLADNNRLDCAFEQVALDFPELFAKGDTLLIARKTLERERGGN